MKRNRLRRAASARGSQTRSTISYSNLPCYQVQLYRYAAVPFLDYIVQYCWSSALGINSRRRGWQMRTACERHLSPFWFEFSRARSARTLTFKATLTRRQMRKSSCSVSAKNLPRQRQAPKTTSMAKRIVAQIVLHEVMENLKSLDLESRAQLFARNVGYCGKVQQEPLFPSQRAIRARNNEDMQLSHKVMYNPVEQLNRFLV